MSDEKIRPLSTYYVPIKENLGYRLVVWPNNLLIEKVSKENEHWKKVQDFSLTRRAVEFLSARSALWLSKWDENAGNN